MQLAASGHCLRVRAVGVFDAKRDVALELPVQPVPQLPAGDELPSRAGERRVVHEEVDGDRRLLDRDALEPLGMLDRSVNVMPISMRLEAGERDDLSRLAPPPPRSGSEPSNV